MVIETIEEFLDLEQDIYKSNAIKYIKYQDHFAQESQLNNDGDFSIYTQNIDGLLLLENSLLIMDVEMKKTGNAAFVDTDSIALTHNGPMYMFGKIKFELDQLVIEHYNNPGIATTVTGLCKYNNGFSKTVGRQQCWVLDEDVGTAAPSSNVGFKIRRKMLLHNNTTKGTCRYIIPFSHISDFKGKIITGIKATLSFTRTPGNHDAIFKTDATGGSAVDNGVLRITRLCWRIPYINLNFEAQLRVEKILSSKPTIPFKYIQKYVHSQTLPESTSYSWNLSTYATFSKITGIVIVFQTDQSNNQTKNSSIFKHCDVTDMKSSLNLIEYPGIALNCGYDSGLFMECYDRYINFRGQFTNGLPEISEEDFKNLYPLYCFDLSHQETRVSGQSLNVIIDMKFKQNVPANTIAYAVVFTEKFVTLTTEGDSKMRIVNT
jgi:hypothetical protein